MDRSDLDEKIFPKPEFSLRVCPLRHVAEKIGSELCNLECLTARVISIACSVTWYGG